MKYKLLSSVSLLEIYELEELYIKEGWELVAVVTRHGRFHYYFKATGRNGR